MSSDVALEKKPERSSLLRTRNLVAAALAVLVVASVATAGFLGVRYAEATQADSARDEAVSVAREQAEVMFGFNPATVEQNIASSLRVLTGDARAVYEQTLSDNNFVDEVNRQQVFSQVAIQDAGIVRSSADSATVLIFLNQSVSRGENEVIRMDPSRVSFDMVKRDSEWLITTIDVITDDSFRSLLEQTDNPPPGAVELTPEGAPQEGDPQGGAGGQGN